jgi:poly(A) polymerase
MIRAVRFAARFGFAIDFDTQEAIRANADTLFPAVAMERIWQEFVKMSKYPNFGMALVEMHRLGLLPAIFTTLQGVHLRVIKERVRCFTDYLENTGTIVHLMALFPETTLSETEDICRYLRISRADGDLAKLLVAGRQLANGEELHQKCEMVGWVHFYADSLSLQCLWAIASTMPDRLAFLQKHQQRQQEMASHIARVVAKKPLVDAALLQRYGIAPGKQMGRLLKEAEVLAINHHLDDAEAVLALLRAGENWPKLDEGSCVG